MSSDIFDVESVRGALAKIRTLILLEERCRQLLTDTEPDIEPLEAFLARTRRDAS